MDKHRSQSINQKVTWAVVGYVLLLVNSKNIASFASNQLEFFEIIDWPVDGCLVPMNSGLLVY